MKVIAIVNTYGTFTDKKTGEVVKYENKKLVGLDEYERDGAKQCTLTVAKCSPDFALPVGTVFEPAYDKYQRIIGKR